MSPTLMPMRNSMRLSTGTGIALSHGVLHLCGTAHRVEGTSELRQKSIPSGLNNTATVHSDLGVCKFVLYSLQFGERAFFVNAHQSRIACHIGGKDCR
jgi:hypothetical protein